MTRFLFALPATLLIALATSAARAESTGAAPERDPATQVKKTRTARATKAQQTLVASNDTTATIANPGYQSIETRTPLAPSFFDTVKPYIKAGWNSQNDSPRGSERDGGKYTFLGKQELYLGARLPKSGWALSLMYTSYQYTYSQQDPKHVDGFQVGDPSVTLGFPTIFKNGSWSLNHQFRYYYPVSHYYVGHQIQNVAYYQFLNGELPGSNEFMNISIERYWYEPNYHPGNSVALWEDRTQIGHRFSPWFRAGVGQWTQNEFHQTTSAGLVTDVYPYADFIINKNLYMGPRYSLPLIASGTVFQGARNVSLSEGFAEFWMQASM